MIMNHERVYAGAIIRCIEGQEHGISDNRSGNMPPQPKTEAAHKYSESQCQDFLQHGKDGIRNQSMPPTTWKTTRMPISTLYKDIWDATRTRVNKP
eukprot:scaffold8374_cov175-Amphora_coffeaeformis.AAC.122